MKIGHAIILASLVIPMVYAESRMPYAPIVKAAAAGLEAIEVNGESYFSAHLRPTDLDLDINTVVIRLERNGKVLATLSPKARSFTEDSLSKDYPWEVLLPFGKQYDDNTELTHNLEPGALDLKLSFDVKRKLEPEIQQTKKLSQTSTVGCIAENARLTKITSLTNRFEILGVSMLPPQEAGWHYEKLSPAKIEFGKITRKDQSFVGLVLLSRLPKIESKDEFIKVLSEQRQRNTGNPRYETLINDEEYSVEKETPSLRFHTKYKDKASPHLPEGKECFIVEDYGIICRHPKAWNVAVFIALSQRTLPGEEQTDWKEIADEFIRGVEFIDVPKE